MMSRDETQINVPSSNSSIQLHQQDDMLLEVLVLVLLADPAV